MEKSLADIENVADISSKFNQKGLHMFQLAEFSLKQLTIPNGLFLKYETACYYYFYSAICYKSAASCNYLKR